eukprot:CAMPEP_0170513958 /NCGR_PEP_ID=MMETSP0209-20121228/531_1 /TAXON_ID=665100 ORGANISM="Litonotus pictus, Strain P1" /NCGR_SAMPLE_ID=MMETSP0209 /ASSEMBLY_ACC=CAM_ASM_000301 /LENGTH=271 /DNA_ID=CAMNT_0010797833 /DNA_START=374 /DNA_END=1189 /DNA_ORIENTATION=+
MAVALKNSKEILFYKLQREDPGINKLKFIKIDKKIKTERKYDIKNVAINNSGDFIATSGFGQDTNIQIFDYNQGVMIGSIDINAIENKEMKLSPDSNYITISTYMYEIAVIGITKVTYHIKNTSTEETNVKVEKKSSVGNITVPINCYDFSNDKNYFFVLTNDNKFKIFRIYGAFNDSKLDSETVMDDCSGSSGSLYIFTEGHKVKGYIVYSDKYSIFIKDLESKKTIKSFVELVDSEILGIKNIEFNKKMLVIVLSRDGKFHVIDPDIFL